nr:hypothetical protein [Tanacetum cinerariifolium]
MILESVENGPLIWHSIEENEVTRPQKYSELSATEAIQADCDVKATNIILQGLPPEAYALVMECKLYDEFDKFAYKKGETLLNQQLEFSQPNSGLIVPVFQKVDDPIDAINHMMSFLIAVVTSRYPTTNNQLRNSSNPRQQATINNERVTLQQIQGRHISLAVGTSRTYTSGASGNNSGKQRIVICYNCKRDDHMSKQCTKPKRKRDDSWFKDKVLLVQAQANGQILHEDELAFLENPGITKSQPTQTVITHNAAYQADDLHTYDSDCDEINIANKAHQLEPKLYDGNIIEKTNAIVIRDSEKTLMLAEESRSKMLLKQKDHMMSEKKVNTTPLDYDEKVLVITALKDNLRKHKGKAIVDEVVISHPIDPEVLKVDVAPLAPKLRNNLTVHSDYIRHTQEETVTLREIVEQGKSLNPLNNSLDYVYTASVLHSKLNVNSNFQCVTCNGCLFYNNHDSCVLDFINNVNARVNSKSVKKPLRRNVWKPTGKVFTHIV